MQPDPDLTPKVELVPTHVGAQGDAVAEHAGRRVFIPFALPGESVRVATQARAGGEMAGEGLEILAPSPDRIAPPCRHFGVCGGCKLQHWAEASYRAWKVDLVRTALRQHGLDMPQQVHTVFLPAGARRRAEFAAAKQAGRLSLGFQEARSHRIVDLRECIVLAPALAGLLAPLRAALDQALVEGQAVDILATSTATGIDLVITADRAATARQRQALARFAADSGIARIAWRAGRAEAEPVAFLRIPQVHFGDVAVDLPTPAFLQPSEAGEAALRSAVLAALGKPKRIIELYAGCGSFTFDLARIGQVHAVDSAKASILALQHAARRAQLSHRITSEVRDLARSPLTPQELRPFDAAVFDPPRPGAKSQSQALARTAIERIVAVSCNPATFARDARTLVDGGFSISTLHVLDQFIWSQHVEIVAGLRRGRVARQ